MVDHLEIVARGRAELLAGNVNREEPPGSGSGRWGLSMLLRPDPPMLDRLTALAREAVSVVGPGQWVHGPRLLHLSLRALAPYEPVPDITGYPEAMAQAIGDCSPIRARVRMVSTHPRGIAVFVFPQDDALDRLYARMAVAVDKAELQNFEDWVRAEWYIHVMHFAADVDVPALIEWCDKRRDLNFGETVFDGVDLVSYRHTGQEMVADTLHRTPFSPRNRSADCLPI